MRRNWIPKRVLAVILAVVLAMTPAVTVKASPVDESAEAVAATEDVEVAEDAVEETSVEADEETSEEVSESTDASEETEAAEADAPQLEEVDPQEEGLVDLTEVLKGEDVESPVETQDPDEQTRVIIVMEGDSVLDKGFDTENLAENKAAMKAVDKIEAQQEKEIEKISEEALNGEQLDVNYSFSILTNAVSADVAYKDIAEIEKVDGVEAVLVAAKHDPLVTAEPQTITSGDMVGSYKTWTTGYTGAGTRIAVIDTGIDVDHVSFDGGAYLAHLKETAEDASKTVADYQLLDSKEIENVLPKLNAYKRDTKEVTSESLYQNAKIPFAFNYIDKDLDITHDNDEKGDHGTHVSGISTANVYVPSATSATGYERQYAGVVGIAPDAQLITMKVFGKAGGANSDDYMAAIEDAILLKADVINLSLGSAEAGNSSDIEEYINDIFKKLEGTSTVVAISAGNSGRWSDSSMYGANLSKDVNLDTVGSPGSYYNALTVASAVNSGLTSYYIELADGKKVFYSNGSDTKAEKLYNFDTTADKTGVELPFVFLSSKGLPEDYENVDVKGKIVFVSRGEITFAEKHMNAAAAGAKAVVIYNNQPGMISMTVKGSDALIPVVSVTQEEGKAAAATGKEVSEGVFEGTLKVVSMPETKRDVEDGYTMSDFSSWGVPDSLDLKPEITGPGGNVFSTKDGNDYGLSSGTSMSSPSVAGQSALVQQYIRENDLAEKNGVSVRTLAQSLIMSTATPLFEDNNKEGLEYSPRTQGAGLSNVQDAVTSPSYILVGDKEGNDGKVKAVLGDDPEKTGSYKFDFDIYNMDVDPQYYELDSSVLTEELFETEGVTFFKGKAHKLNPEISLTADNTKLVYDLNDDGKVNTKDRKVLLQVVNDTKQVDIVNTREDYFDFNKDGVVNTKDVFVFSKAINGKDASVDLGLKVVEVKDSTKVSVAINLSKEDREYLAGFENGMYVDGFIYAKGPVNLSVPFLAFYGSWMDSPMFEDFDYMRYMHDEEYAENVMTYTGREMTNFLSFFPLGIPSEKYYVPNFFADDEKYMPERNAISSLNGTVLGGQYYSLMRNASRLILTIKNKNTNEVYFEEVSKDNYAEFFYENEGRWVEDINVQDIFWAATDANGKALPEGTEVEVSLQAIPSYYDDVEDVSTLNAPGMFIKTPMTIDNTQPAVTDCVKNADGKYEITVYDNRYTASVVVVAKDKETVLGEYAVNQETPDEEKVITIDAPEDVFYVEVYDYALNSRSYRYNNTGHADTEFVTDITVDKSEVELQVGKSAAVKATVSPKWLAEDFDQVTWSSEDPSVATVSKAGVITGKKVGETTVKVTTKATDKKGKHLTAEVKVKVVEKQKPKDDEEPVEDETDSTDSKDNKSEDVKAEDTKVEDADTSEESDTKDSDETDSNKKADAKASEENVAEDQLGGENDE